MEGSTEPVASVNTGVMNPEEGLPPVTDEGMQGDCSQEGAAEEEEESMGTFCRNVCFLLLFVAGAGAVVYFAISLSSKPNATTLPPMTTIAPRFAFQSDVTSVYLSFHLDVEYDKTSKVQNFSTDLTAKLAALFDAENHIQNLQLDKELGFPNSTRVMVQLHGFPNGESLANRMNFIDSVLQNKLGKINLVEVGDLKIPIIYRTFRHFNVKPPPQEECASVNVEALASATSSKCTEAVKIFLDDVDANNKANCDLAWDITRCIVSNWGDEGKTCTPKMVQGEANNIAMGALFDDPQKITVVLKKYMSWMDLSIFLRNPRILMAFGDNLYEKLGPVFAPVAKNIPEVTSNFKGFLNLTPLLPLMTGGGKLFNMDDTEKVVKIFETLKKVAIPFLRFLTEEATFMTPNQIQRGKEVMKDLPPIFKLGDELIYIIHVSKCYYADYTP